MLCLGLVYDGGQVLRTKDRATVLAQEAARAGAQQIDWAAYREGEGATLDPLAAGRAARAFLADTGTGGTVSVSGETVTVTCSLSHDFTLLPLGSVTVDGTASARPFSEPTP
ncbi:hypothetical protein EMG21_32170 [Klebsiella pneumoniae]|nr:hypothetical protein EMG21_32170 [Klebsiella pneumoniae]